VGEAGDGEVLDAFRLTADVEADGLKEADEAGVASSRST